MTDETEMKSASEDKLPAASHVAQNAEADIQTGADILTPVERMESIARNLAESIADTLAEARHELHLLAHASKFEWVNKRLILLRNAVIALSVIVVVVIVTVLCYHEAYKQTLTISAFEVPEKLAERGITGQAVAKGLFDELIKRRKTVTTLDVGELKSAWSESHNDVALPQAGFTLQSLFHYLRTLTGTEIAIDGEMLVEGDEISITARVAGNPPREVKGKLSEWKVLMGDLANYVFETTQPAVLASYWGLTANTPDEMDALSRLIYRMATVEPKAAPAALSVAYYAYGVALNRQNKITEALAAWEQSRTLDPKFAPPYIAAAQVLFQRDNAASAKLYQQSATLEVSKATRVSALGSQLSLAGNINDCQRMRTVLAELQPLAMDELMTMRDAQAKYMVRCDYQQAKAVAIYRNLTLLHPDVANFWNSLGGAELARELRPGYLQDARLVFESGIAVDKENKNNNVRLNLSPILAQLGEHEAALAMYKAGLVTSRLTEALNLRAQLHFYKGEFKEAEALLRRQLAETANVRSNSYRYLGRTLEAQNRTAEAIDALRAGTVERPLYRQNYDEAAGILLKHGRDAEAFAEWEKGIAAVPKYDQTYVHFAQALIERKRVAEAKQKLETLLKVSPESDGAEIAKEMLAGMAKAG